MPLSEIAECSPTDSASQRAHLTPFGDAWASTVASWIRTDQELLYLAPGTPAPITEKKVCDWGLERRRRHLLWLNQTPVGYAELNEMPGSADQFWIGHFLVDPARRGQGIGRQFAQALVARAFAELDAADVLLVVFPENLAAIACYERAGLVALGKERKSFPTTGREHVFLRMGINRAAYQRLVAIGQLPMRPLPFIEH